MPRLPTRVLLIVLATTVACSAGEGNGRRFVSLGTAGTGGIYYPLGGALARMLSERLPGTSFTAEVTGGSVENLNRTASGEIDLGLAIGATLAKALEDDGARFGTLRVIAPLYPNVAHVMAAPASSVASLTDMAGARISVGAAGSGTEQMSRDLIVAHGVGLDELSLRYLSFSESALALRDGAIDLAILSVGYPASSVLEATTAAGVRLLPIEPGPLGALMQTHSYYLADSIPAGVYAGVDTEIGTAAVMNWVFADATLDDEIAVAVLEILRDRGDDLAQVNDIARQIDLQTTYRPPMPLHDASRAWLEGMQN